MITCMPIAHVGRHRMMRAADDHGDERRAEDLHHGGVIAPKQCNNDEDEATGAARWPIAVRRGARNFPVPDLGRPEAAARLLSGAANVSERHQRGPPMNEIPMIQMTDGQTMETRRGSPRAQPFALMGAEAVPGIPDQVSDAPNMWCMSAQV